MTRADTGSTTPGCERVSHQGTTPATTPGRNQQETRASRDGCLRPHQHLPTPWDATPPALPNNGARTVMVDTRVNAVAFGTTAEGRLLLVSASNDRTVRLWDLTKGICITTVRRRSSVRSIALHGPLLAIGDDEAVSVIEPC
jgi:WD40 repeat protein